MIWMQRKLLPETVLKPIIETLGTRVHDADAAVAGADSATGRNMLKSARSLLCVAVVMPGWCMEVVETTL